MTLTDLFGVTSSPGSVAGTTPCSLPGGLRAGRCGREVAPARRSARPRCTSPLWTRPGAGPTSCVSSGPSALRSCLESSLQARMGLFGSMEYGVWSDLEGGGYSFWASSLCAAGVGSPHVRQRSFWLGHADCEGLEGHSGDAGVQQEPGRLCPQADGPVSTAGVHDHWDRWRLVERTEPTKGGGQMVKRSRVQPESFPMADGIPERVGLLRGYGNAIVPQVAAEFVGSYMDVVA